MTVIPVLQIIKELYQAPRNKRRFDRYLELLQGPDKADMILPIAGFNPMATDHVLQQVLSLLELKAEELVTTVIEELQISENQLTSNLKVAINLGDDLGGAWTQRYVTDYDSKYKLGSLLKRDYCIIYLWSSETYSTDLILRRSRAYVLRYLYQQEHGAPITLEEHLSQENFVYRCVTKTIPILSAFQQAYLSEHLLSSDHSVIFNFLYGDEASQEIGYRTMGNSRGYQFYDH